MRKDSGSSNNSDGSFTYSPMPYGYNPQPQQIYGQPQQPIYQQQNQYQQPINIGIGVNQINSQNIGGQYGYNAYGYSTDPYGQGYKY